MTLAPDLWTTLWGVLMLREDAFLQSLHLGHAYAAAFAIVLLAALSEALGQSIVLFANRVKPARFVLSIAINSLLFAFGYAFLLLSTYAVCAAPGAAHVSFEQLAIVFALSYAPMVFSFWTALPYAGDGLLWIARIWHLLAMVVGVSAIAHVALMTGLTYVGLGWFVMVIAQLTFGRPVARFGAQLLNAAAGVTLIGDEQLAIARQSSMEVTTPATGAEAPHETGTVSVTPKGRVQPQPDRMATILGLLFVAALTILVTLALMPLEHAAPQWYTHLPREARVPFDLAWIGLIAFLVAGLLAPAETLGWWAGWYGGKIGVETDTDRLDDRKARDDVLRYVIYLDGIAQSSSHYTPDVETFLDALAPRLPKHTRLIRGIMVYSVLNRPLESDPAFSRFWAFIDKMRLGNTGSLLGMFINLRNVLIVGVSADKRYGPLYNFGIAQLLYKGLVQNGYKLKSGTPVTLIGYSGGGQMSAAAAFYLKRAIDAPIDVISLGGVMSGSCRFLELEHLYHLVGSKDHVQILGPIMFPSRWKLFFLSYWNRARRLGVITQIPLGPVAHQVPGGMLDPHAILPDGRSNLRQTLDYITTILRGRLHVAIPGLIKKASNYDRYAQAAWNRSEYYPLHRVPDPNLYRPSAMWMGRLILPKLAERASVGGAWFEVHHADEAHAHLAARIVKLRWSDEPEVRDVVRAATSDVHFSAYAEYSSRYAGRVHPVRVNNWQVVDPLESLAGSHPVDDVIVMLAGDVVVEDGADPILRIARQPVQITGRYCGLVRFLEPLAGERFRVAHFNAASAAFDGPASIVHLPHVVTDTDGRAPSSTLGLERSPLNDAGWYVYGAPDVDGTFVVQALGPRELLRVSAERQRPGGPHAYRDVRSGSWSEIVARKGTIRSVRFDGAPDPWKTGDRALLLHVYGGIGGRRREPLAKSLFYFGHFAYGTAEVVWEPLAGEPRFEILYNQVYAHNTDGLVAGVLHWSRYMGDRQFGWAGARPVCDLLLRDDAFSGDFELEDTRCTSALAGLQMQLEAMTARYRTGDGTGATFAGPANNCSQDANHALFAALRNLTAFIEAHPAFDAWAARNPEQAQRYRALERLRQDLRRVLQPFGSPRHDWSENEFNLGSSLEDTTAQTILAGLQSWRMIFPRLASDTLLRTFLRNGAAVWMLSTDQIGGENLEIEPIAPAG
jgi:predicted Abi (CAAX) family protease